MPEGSHDGTLSRGCVAFMLALNALVDRLDAVIDPRIEHSRAGRDAEMEAT